MLDLAETAGAGDADVADDSETEPTFWVGIGASAGGLEALRSILEHLPTELPATYVIAQHMAPHQKSLLTEILGRETTLPVADATDDLQPLSNTIYVCPPNSHIVVENGRLHLETPRADRIKPKPSIDTFFESLARDRGTRAIGIVLSGTGSDGAKGIEAIKENGGLTIAQDEHTAKYTGMPQASQDTGKVDMVLSPEEIGSRFQEILEDPNGMLVSERPSIENDSIAEINRLLREQTRVDFSHYKSATFLRRVERRMHAVRVETLSEYVDTIAVSPEEVDALFRDMLISVTSFFRDPNEFTALRRHIENLVEDKRDAPIRVWVPGVATGEEAYTIAILFAEILGGPRHFSTRNVQIFATDLDTSALEIARRGFYAEGSLGALTPEQLETYFDPAPSGYTVRKLIREKIVFSAHDVTRDPPFQNLNLLSCRNLLIYFKTELQARVFNRFHYALRSDGILFLGKCEAVSASRDLFESAYPDKHVFFPVKGRRSGVEFQQYSNFNAETPKSTARLVDSTQKVKSLGSQLDSLIAAIGPNAMLLSKDAHLLKVYGDVDQYVGLSPRYKIDTSALALLRNPWSQDIRIAIPSVLRSMTIYEGVTHTDPKDRNRQHRITIYPIEDRAQGVKQALVIFKSWIAPPPDEFSDEASDDEQQRLRQTVKELTRELELTKNNLQTTVEELETSNEELQSINEEMQASHEELQSTNEELETSSEELQSTNEELFTSNEELNINAQRLTELNRSLRSILDNVITPMVVVDKQLNIVDAGRSSSQYVQIPPSLERPHLGNCKLPDGFPALVPLVEEAIETNTSVSRLVAVPSAEATISIAPYADEFDEVLGAIIQISDNADAIRSIKDELERIFENAPTAILLCSAEGEIVNLNSRAQRWLEGPGQKVLSGKSLYDFLPEDIRNDYQKSDRRILDQGSVDQDWLFKLEVEQHNPRWISVKRVPFEDDDTGTMLLAMWEDVTAQHDEEIRSQYLRSRLDLALNVSGIGTWEWSVGSGATYWSERFKEIVGVPKDHEPGDGAFLELVHEDDKTAFRHTQNRLAKRGESFDVRVRVVRPDGKTRWVSIRGQRFQSDWMPDRVIGTLSDDTDIINQLERARAKNSHLQLAERLSGTGYWSVSLGDNNELLWSDMVYKIHGLDKANYTPTVEDALTYYHEDDRDRVSQFVEEAMRKQSGFQFKARIRRKDGAIRTVSSLGVAQVDRHGKTTQIFGVFQDITDTELREAGLRETSEALARSNEELNRFSYVCSHDMKEPVRLIESMSELLQEPDVADDPSQSRELLKRIHANTGRLRAIIDSLLAYSRVDATIEFVDIDLDEVALEVRENLTLLIEEKGATVEIGRLPVVRGARVHFTQLFQNLIGNALTYADKSAARIRLSSERAGKFTEIHVEDNGPGVPPQHRDEIFDVFTRLELTSKVEGSGLGLSICKRIVTQYGGTISCTSSPLGGARFTIRLPSETRDDD